jgi:hypothetical protein
MFVVPCLGCFVPVHLRMLQVVQYVAVVGGRPRFICSERSHCRSEQPDQRSPTRLRQSLLNGAAQTRAAITGGNADLSSACPQRGPPPTLTITSESADSGFVVTWFW